MSARPAPPPQPLPLRPAFGPAGMATPRLARFAARMAFVDVKRQFLAAVSGLDDAPWLQRQVRATEQPTDLWLLRGAVFDALAAAGRSSETPLLRVGLATLFPHGAPTVRR